MKRCRCGHVESVHSPMCLGGAICHCGHFQTVEEWDHMETFEERERRLTQDRKTANGISE